MIIQGQLEKVLESWGALTQDLVETIEKMQEENSLGLFEETAPYGKAIRYAKVWDGEKGRYIWQYLERDGSTKGFVYGLDSKENRRVVIHSPYKGFLDEDKLLEDREEYLKYLAEFRKEHKNKTWIFWETEFKPPANCREPIFHVVGEHLGTFTCFRDLFFNVSINNFHREIPKTKKDLYSYENLCGRYEKGTVFLIRSLPQQEVQEYESLINQHKEIRRDYRLRRILQELSITKGKE